MTSPQRHHQQKRSRSPETEVNKEQEEKARAAKRARKQALVEDAFNLVEYSIRKAADKLSYMAENGLWQTEPGSTPYRPIYRYPWTSEPLASLTKAAGGVEYFRENYLVLLDDALNLGGQNNERIHGVEFSVWRPEYLPGNEEMLSKMQKEKR